MADKFGYYGVRYLDMGDGTWAEVVASVPASAAPDYDADTSFPVVSAVIADGQSLSAAVDVRGYQITQLSFPAGWAAASKTFQTSIDGVTFNNLVDSNGAEVTVPSHGGGAKAQGLYSDVMLALRGARYIKIRSGTSGTPVAQAGGDTVSFVLEPL